LHVALRINVDRYKIIFHVLAFAIAMQMYKINITTFVAAT